MNLSNSGNLLPREDQAVSPPMGTRRGLFKWVTGLSSAFIGLSLAIPLIGYVIAPALKRRQASWMPVGKVKDLPVDEPKDLDYVVTVEDGYLQTQQTKAVWTLKHQDETVTVFSPICPHLGCGFRWDSHDRKFKCPCHGSVYDINGKVVDGPAPRSLDVLPSKIENGELLVIYKEYKSGLSTQVEL